MIYSDCHVHSSISSDSDSLMTDMVESAIKKGIKNIYFTEHMDYEFPKTYPMNFLFSPDEYFDSVEKCRTKYKDKINIYNGIELGLKDTLRKDYTELLSSYPWDFVIGSTHIVGEYDPYYSEYWEHKSIFEGVYAYFEQTYNNIMSFNDFDSLGHLDYILRYAPEDFDVMYIYEKCFNIIDKILGFIIERDIALEINTSGFRKKINTTNPGIPVLKRYIELGGKYFTVGSDAHSPENIALKFDSLENIMTGVGIEEYCTYIKRKPVLNRL